jgi:hypothetical protein
MALGVFTYVRGVCGLAAGVPAAGLRVRGCPPLVTLVREGRVSSPQFVSEVSGRKLCSALGWASAEDRHQAHFPF